MLPNEAHGYHGCAHRFPSLVVVRSRYSTTFLPSSSKLGFPGFERSSFWLASRWQSSFWLILAEISAIGIARDGFAVALVLETWL